MKKYIKPSIRKVDVESATIFACSNTEEEECLDIEYSGPNPIWGNMNKINAD